MKVMDATSVTAAMRALSRIPTDHHDRMVAELDALSGFVSCTMSPMSPMSGAQLASAVRAVRAARPRSLLVALAEGPTDRDWGPIALFEELTGVGEMAVLHAGCGGDTPARCPASAFYACCRASTVPPASRDAWDLVITDVPAGGPPACAASVAVLLGATNDACATWAAAPAVAWHHRFGAMLVVGLL